MTAWHHHGIVPDYQDLQPLAKVTHHLVLVLAKVPRQLPPQPGDGLQAHLVPAVKGVNSQGEALHLASYLRSFSLWAWATAESPSSEVLTTKAC